MKTHKDLKLWQQAIELVLFVYEITDKYPRHEMFCLTAHTRKTAVSVPSNIAEGAGRRSPKELKNFLSISLGSQAELDTQLIVGYKLKYFDDADYARIETKLTKVRKLTLGLIRAVSCE